MAPSEPRARELLRAVYQGDVLCQRWLVGRPKGGGVQPEPLQSYLEEFCFRFNRVTPGRRTAVLRTPAVCRRRLAADQRKSVAISPPEANTPAGVQGLDPGRPLALCRLRTDPGGLLTARSDLQI